LAACGGRQRPADQLNIVIGLVNQPLSLATNSFLVKPKACMPSKATFSGAKGLSAKQSPGPRPHQTQYAGDNQVNRHNNAQQAGLNQYQDPGD
jgi:hypothetical protein